MEATNSLEAQLNLLEQELRVAKADLRAHLLAADEFSALSTTLLAQIAALKNEITARNQPTPAPAPAPVPATPGNSLTLPQVLPLLRSPFLPPIRYYN